MKHFGTIWLFVICFSSAVIGQNGKFRTYLGLGGSIGTSNYVGDLDDNFTPRYTKPAFGLHLLYNFRPHFGFRFNFFKGTITASDVSGTMAGNKERNLSFYTPVSELGLNLVYRPLAMHKGELPRRRISPYLFAGIAVFRFNPMTTLGGEEIELQPLGTEGQYLIGDYPEPYKLTQLAVPMGAGINFKISRRVDLGVESGFRKTFTDYLDDVSTNYPDLDQLAEVSPVAAALSNRSGSPVVPGAPRGNPDLKDWYIYTNVGFTFYFYSSPLNSPSLEEKCFKFK
jgi:hypothetical protein